MSSAPPAPPVYPGQRNDLSYGLAISHAPTTPGLDPAAEAYENAKSRAHAASADVDLNAPWPAFREQLERLEELLSAQQDRPAPPPADLHGGYYFDGTMFFPGI